MKTAFTAIFILMITACTDTQQAFEFPQGHRIFTRDDARLYFQNVRSPYYTMEENKAAGIRQYRLKHGSADSLTPHFQLCIADAWQRNEVYLIPEPNAWFETDTFSVKCDCGGSITQIRYRQMSPAESSRWVYALYKKRREGCSLSVKGTPLFNAEQEKDFRKVVQDYLKWID